jgi:hypothetical protein
MRKGKICFMVGNYCLLFSWWQDLPAGTLYAQEHIAAGATWLGSKIEQQGKRWEQQTTPNANPTTVSPATLKTLHFASGAARTGANVAGRVVSGVASVTASAADVVVRCVPSFEKIDDVWCLR